VNLHPLLDVGRNMVTKDKEKAEVLHVVLPQSLIVRPVVLGVPSPLSWKTGMGNKMKPP